MRAGRANKDGILSRGRFWGLKGLRPRVLLVVWESFWARIWGFRLRWIGFSRRTNGEKRKRGVLRWKIGRADRKKRKIWKFFLKDQWNVGRTWWKNEVWAGFAPAGPANESGIWRGRGFLAKNTRNLRDSADARMIMRQEISSLTAAGRFSTQRGWVLDQKRLHFDTFGLRKRDTNGVVGNWDRKTSHFRSGKIGRCQERVFLF